MPKTSIAAINTPKIYFIGTPEIKSIEIPVREIKIKLLVSGCLNKITAMMANMMQSGRIPKRKSCTLFFAQESQAAK